MTARRCVHCFQRITADSKRELWRAYTAHVTTHHDKPEDVGVEA